MLKNQNNENIYLKLVASTDNYMDSMRCNIGLLRTYYGWSVRVLAEKANISEDTLQTFLKGKSKDCNLFTAIRLAKALNVSVDELVGAETIEKETRECLAMSRNMPDYVRYLNRVFVKHQYKIHSQFDNESKNIPVLLPECVNGYLKTTNITSTVCVDQLTDSAKSKVCLGLQIPCDHYEPFYMPNDIVLLSADRSAVNNERCVVCHKGNYFFAIKKIYIEGSEKKVKYISMIGGNTVVFPNEIDDKLGYVVGFLNPDGSWGIR